MPQITSALATGTTAPPTSPAPALKRRSRTTGERLQTVLFIASLGWLALLLVLMFVSMATPWLDPFQQDFGATKQAPGFAHPFGTDANGRDVLARTVAGAQNSFTVAAITLVVGAVTGSVIGIVCGYFRGWFDSVVGLALDTLMAFPALMLIILLVSFRGPSLWTIGGAIGLLMIPSFARVTRSITLSVRSREYVQAAVLIDTPTPRILLTAVLPAVAPVLVAYAFTAVTVGIVAEGSMSFLGYGLAAPAPSWGGIIAEGRTALAQAPWITLAPAATLTITVLAINVIGERFKEKRK